ncbi:hypothetical protein P171DRAFT_288907 [Karstenula rhodostoma CBS 690.94]|uniref:Uncharacterized protein n=1 Tax=Karstenula rhodostoma CBS 690.94 TaxID=1392251 RepID=A0A9P4PKR4_9PLEO|nr:hypothetical protein P171DRAFT_288907 [Karstenula rhodostoma CBS 690.94]
MLSPPRTALSQRRTACTIERGADPNRLHPARAFYRRASHFRVSTIPRPLDYQPPALVPSWQPAQGPGHAMECFPLRWETRCSTSMAAVFSFHPSRSATLSLPPRQRSSNMGRESVSTGPADHVRARLHALHTWSRTVYLPYRPELATARSQGRGCGEDVAAALVNNCSAGGHASFRVALNRSPDPPSIECDPWVLHHGQYSTSWNSEQ